MLPEGTLPVSMQVLLAVFQPCFTAPSFRTFCALACGFWAQTGRKSVCGMLTGAGLSRIWPHHRAHYFFARARWQPGDLGLALARLVVTALVPDGEPVTVAVDDTLFRRRGKKVWAAGWFHDGSGAGKDKTGYGNNWVIAGIVVTLPMVSRPVCLPVLARLVVKGTNSKSRLWLARRMIEDLAAALPGRDICVVADAAYAGKELRNLPATVTWTTRLRKDAALHELPPPRTGRRGRPRTKGDRLGTADDIAATASWTTVTITAYGRQQVRHVTEATCLWYGSWHTRAVRLILSRDEHTASGYDLALVTTDRTAAPGALVARYATRWAIEQAFADARNVLGAGEARNRVRRAVERTVPFALLVHTLVVLWYARHGHDPADIDDRRAAQPWNRTKTEPAFEDMLIKLRRVLIAARFSGSHPAQPTGDQIRAVLAAWDAAAA